MSGIENCVVSTAYLERKDSDDVQQKLKRWVSKDKGGIRVVTGEAGSGKTNCLLNLIVSEKLYERRCVIWFPLFRFAPEESLLSNLQRYLRSIFDGEMADLTFALSELLRRSDTILILDGLDELSRTKGRAIAEKLWHALRDELPLDDPHDAPSILISCRRDIFANLKRDPYLKGVATIGPIKPLPSEEVSKTLPGISPEVAEFLSKYPLFLRFLHGWSTSISVPTTSSQLFEALTPTAGAGRDENLKSLGRIAEEMLTNRQDFVKPTKGEKKHWAHFFEPNPLQMLLEEKNGDVRFLHHTVREFVLAWNVHESLTADNLDDWHLLTETSDLDYEGSEVHRAVSELRPKPVWSEARDRWGKLKDRTRKDRDRKNNFAWSCFETAGMLGMLKVPAKQRKTMLDWIHEALTRPMTGQDAKYSFNAKYNAARCLERIHPSAPECYWQWVVKTRKARKGAAGKDAEKDRTGHLIHAYAVRGFQRTDLEIGKHPSLLMCDKGVRGGAKRDSEQERFSEVLVSGVEHLAKYVEIGEGQFYLLINLSYALIRWYSPKHRKRVEALLKRPDLDERVDINLRLALWCWHDDRQDDRITEVNGRVDGRRIDG